MIRPVALGVLFLAVTGAIGPVARDKTPKPSGQREFPVTVGTRADRLPITIRPAGDSDLPNAEESRPSLPEHQPEAQVPAPEAEPKDEAVPAIASRHWHDPTDLKPKKVNHPTVNRGPSQSTKRAADPNARQVVEEKDCRSDGLYPLLRKMNLSPPCD